MSPVRPIRDLGLALGFLTVLPVGRDRPAKGAAAAVGFYPWVGWVLGGAGAGLAWLLGLVGADAFLTAALVVGAWGLGTRMLHWDGLADTADGLWGSFERERRLEIMRDSRVGSFGATAVVLTALVQVAAVSAAVSRGSLWALVAAPVVARVAAVGAAWTLPAARREGLGLTAMERPGAYALVAASLGVLALGLLAFWAAPLPLAITVAAGVVAGIALPRVLAARAGGMTGDLFGATVLGVETAVLVAAALVGRGGGI